MDHLTSYEVICFIKEHEYEIETEGTDESWTARINAEANLAMEITIVNYQSLCKKLKVAKFAPVVDLDLYEKKISLLARWTAELYVQYGVKVPDQLRAMIS